MGIYRTDRKYTLEKKCTWNIFKDLLHTRLQNGLRYFKEPMWYRKSLLTIMKFKLEINRKRE